MALESPRVKSLGQLRRLRLSPNRSVYTRILAGYNPNATYVLRPELLQVTMIWSSRLRSLPVVVERDILTTV
jgi:hypothetical protein